MFGPLIVRPAKSKGVKTGSWRVQVKPKFLQKNCIGCKMCALICPEGCITGQGKVYDADFEYCKGCGLCAITCPKKDIEMVDEGENK